jgi:hypothetical protein
MNILIIILEVLFIIYDLNKQYKEIINLNNIILEQKSEIIKINCTNQNLIIIMILLVKNILIFHFVLFLFI